MSRPCNIWMSIHSYVSMFFLPFALVYAVTGAISLGEERHSPRPPLPLGANVARESTALPPGVSPEMSRTERPKSEDPEAMEHAGPPRKAPSGVIGKLVMFHKGFGSPLVKVTGLSFAASLVLMYISGIWVGWSSTSRRKGMLIALVLGLLATTATIAFGLSGSP